MTYAVQALTGLVGDTPRFDRVYCHDRYVMSGEPTAFSLICAPHIPPTNTKEKLTDHNLLSAAGIVIEAIRTREGMKITIDLKALKVPANLFSGTEEDLIRYAFECIRMTADLSKVKEYTIDIRASEKNQSPAEAIRANFAGHDKKKPFVLHPAEQ